MQEANANLPWSMQGIAFNPVAGGTTLARAAVLFNGGTFGVWELDSKLDLRQVVLGCTHFYDAS